MHEISSKSFYQIFAIYTLKIKDNFKRSFLILTINKYTHIYLNYPYICKCMHTYMYVYMY